MPEWEIWDSLIKISFNFKMKIIHLFVKNFLCFLFSFVLGFAIKLLQPTG